MEFFVGKDGLRDDGCKKTSIIGLSTFHREVTGFYLLNKSKYSHMAKSLFRANPVISFSTRFFLNSDINLNGLSAKILSNKLLYLAI